MSEKPSAASLPTTPPPADADPVKPASPFNRHFHAPRRPKQPREPSGRVPPPSPAWMQKPLRPPGFPKTGG